MDAGDHQRKDGKMDPHVFLGEILVGDDVGVSKKNGGKIKHKKFSLAVIIGNPTCR